MKTLSTDDFFVLELYRMVLESFVILNFCSFIPRVHPIWSPWLPIDIWYELISLLSLQFNSQVPLELCGQVNSVFGYTFEMMIYKF